MIHSQQPGLRQHHCDPSQPPHPPHRTPSSQSPPAAPHPLHPPIQRCTSPSVPQRRIRGGLNRRALLQQSDLVLVGSGVHTWGVTLAPGWGVGRERERERGETEKGRAGERGAGDVVGREGEREMGREDEGGRATGGEVEGAQGREEGRKSKRTRETQGGERETTRERPGHAHKSCSSGFHS